MVDGAEPPRDNSVSTFPEKDYLEFATVPLLPTVREIDRVAWFPCT